MDPTFAPIDVMSGIFGMLVELIGVLKFSKAADATQEVGRRVCMQDLVSIGRNLACIAAHAGKAETR